jgi:phosphoglucosamine mutase
VDCANGASSYIAPHIFSDLGFRVIAIHASPDGQNINTDCGSLHPQRLSEKVIETQADIGIAYDGDADRALWVDNNGRMLNGDHTLFILSNFMKTKGQLSSDYIVATTMSNLGLEKALEKIDLKLYRTQVGDKYVLEQMKKLNANLGGEQSGHTIFLDDCPTGDGILTSLKILEVMVTEEAQLSELVSGYQEFPQILENVSVSKKIDFYQFPEIKSIIDSVRNNLGTTGRLDVRFSGTESLARIMIEGDSKTKIKEYASNIAKIIEKHLGTKPN